MFKIDTYRLLRQNFNAPYDPIKIKGKEYILLRGEDAQYYVPYDKQVCKILVDILLTFYVEEVL